MSLHQRLRPALMASALLLAAACAHTQDETTTASSASATAPTGVAAAQQPTEERAALVGRDMSKLTSAAPEPEGPGTQLGPYAEITIAPAGGKPTHTIYYPTSLADFSASNQLPVLVWGNGACRNEGRRFEQTLTKVASHGYLAIAVGNYEFDEAAPSTTGAQMIEGIDWAEKANTADGPLKGKINTNEIAVMGQSCGGLMTIDAAHDPRIDTIGVINSGAYVGAGLSSVTVSKEDLQKIHSPALYLNGGEADAAFPNANDDYERITKVPVFYGVMEGAGHVATHRHKNGGRFAEVITAWLDWRLKHDTTAAKMFTGADCGLCTDPAWTVHRKQID